MSEFFLRLIQHLRAMWRHRWAGLFTAWTVAVITTIGVFSIPKKYEASARISVNTDSILKPLMVGVTVQPETNQRVATSTEPLTVAYIDEILAQSCPEQRISRGIDIDLRRLDTQGFIVPSRSNSMISEEFRIVKRPLLANAFAQNAITVRKPNLVMVTSALPGEGKSFTSLNLAISIAMEFERTVLLVDGDVRKPVLPHLLGVHPQHGLLDVLQDKRMAFSQVLLHTNIEKLSFLMAGTPDARATELLSSYAMASLLSQMATRYPDRIILFDSPPLLTSTESRALAAHMGQIVLVVKAG